MIDRVFKPITTTVNGVTHTKLREGRDGTGVIMRFHCAFCKNGDQVQYAFRTQGERNRHAQRCLG
jgi:hypothetical protein